MKIKKVKKVNKKCFSALQIKNVFILSSIFKNSSVFSSIFFFFSVFFLYIKHGSKILSKQKQKLQRKLCDTLLQVPLVTKLLKT